MKKLLFVTIFAALAALAQQTAPKLAGIWQMSLETEQGNVAGPMDLKQEGGKLNGSFDAGALGMVPVTGEAQGEKVTLTLALHGGGFMLKLNGTLQGSKMAGTPESIPGKWSATR